MAILVQQELVSSEGLGCCIAFGPRLVLPMQCHKVVLEVAHDIPLSGHLGKGKTAQCILQIFYLPTLSRDVAEYCRT